MTGCIKWKVDRVIQEGHLDLLQTGKGEAESLTYWRHAIVNRLCVITLGSSMLRETLGETLSGRQLQLLGEIEHSADDLSALIKGLPDFPAGRQSATPAT